MVSFRNAFGFEILFVDRVVHFSIQADFSHKQKGTFDYETSYLPEDDVNLRLVIVSVYNTHTSDSIHSMEKVLFYE